MANTNSKLIERIGYGLGDMSSSMFWKIFTYYLPFFYSNVFGLSLADAGTLLLITKLYDAISDPVMGMIADRTRTRWGKYRPYLLWGAIPFAVAGILTFTTPEGTYGFKITYAYLTYLLMMTAYTMVNVPYGAMLGVMTDDPKEKTVFSSFRMFFAFAGSFIALAIFEPLQAAFIGGVEDPGHYVIAKSWQHSMAVVGGICAILFILCFMLTRERVKSVPVEGKKNASIGKDLKDLVKNGPWWILLLVAIGILIFNSIRGGAAAYYFNDFIGGNAIFTCGIFLAVGEISNMVGVALAVPISNYLGKKNTYFFCMLIATALSIPVMLLPATPGGLWALLSLQVLMNVAIGVTFPLLWSMFADIADYSEYKNGNASTGLIFSSSSMAQKFGGAFGSALILWLLAAFGYDTSLGAVQNETALFGLRSMMSWIPAIGSAIAMIAVYFYPLTDKKMAEITATLNERRNNAKTE